MPPPPLVRTLVAAALATCVRTAHAAPPPIAWDAPPGCPSQAEVESLVAAMLAGSQRSAPEGTRLRFTVVRDVGRWQLRAALDGPNGGGERTLGARDCTALAEAAALMAAITVDPAASPLELPAAQIDPGEPTVPPPPPEPAPEAAPAPPAPQVMPDPPPAPEDMPDPPAPPQPARARLRGELGVAVGLGLGALPRPAALLRLHGGLRTRRFAAGVRVSGWLPREAAVPGHPEVGGRFWLVGAGVYACGVVRGGRRVELPLCAAVDAGALGGRGTGDLAVERTAVSPWVGLSAGPGLNVAVHPRLAVTAQLEGLAVLARPRFEIEGRGAACCTSVLGGQFTAGLTVRLP